MKASPHDGLVWVFSTMTIVVRAHVEGCPYLDRLRRGTHPVREPYDKENLLECGFPVKLCRCVPNRNKAKLAKLAGL